MIKEITYIKERLAIPSPQAKLLELAKKNPSHFSELTLRQMADRTGIANPQSVKHHLDKLISFGVIKRTMSYYEFITEDKRK